MSKIDNELGASVNNMLASQPGRNMMRKHNIPRIGKLNMILAPNSAGSLHPEGSALSAADVQFSTAPVRLRQPRQPPRESREPLELLPRCGPSPSYYAEISKSPTAAPRECHADNAPLKVNVAELDYNEEARKLWRQLDQDAFRKRAPRNNNIGMEADRLKRGHKLNNLWTRLNLDPSIISGEPFSALDPLWRHPTSDGIFYVGNQMAASSLPLLQKHKITHVVNCTDNMPLYHERSADANIKYYRFDIKSHCGKVRTEKDAVRFVKPMLDFVGTALAKGHNVMVHCLAGAHRAGTTGVICLMHFANMNVEEAVTAAKRCRSVIDPIGGFPTLLALFETGLEHWRAKHHPMCAASIDTSDYLRIRDPAEQHSLVKASLHYAPQAYVDPGTAFTKLASHYVEDPDSDNSGNPLQKARKNIKRVRRWVKNRLQWFNGLTRPT